MKRRVHTISQRASGGVSPGYGECVTAQPLLVRGGWIHRIRVQRGGYVEPCTRAWCGELIDERYRMLAQAKRFPHSPCAYTTFCEPQASAASASVTRGICFPTATGPDTAGGRREEEEEFEIFPIFPDPAVMA